MVWEQKQSGNEQAIATLKASLNVSFSIAELLVQREIYTFEDAKHYFRPALKNLHSPFLMKDMHKAVKRIQNALANKSSILVYGDYDVDGTTSVALVYSYLKQLNPNTYSYIPDRYTEGYGLSNQGIQHAIDQNINLIICLDCGIKAIDKVAFAAQNSIDIIILVPNKYAVISIF